MRMLSTASWPSQLGDWQMFISQTDVSNVPCAQVHLGYRPHDAAGINVRDLAYDARGFTGAQLGSLVNTAAGLAGREGREMITQADLRKVLHI